MTNSDTVRGKLLSEAIRLTEGDRNKTYGSPYGNLSLTARLVSTFIGTTVTASQMAVIMALVKIARLVQTPDHKDSHLDAAAYMAIAYECELSEANE